VRELQPLIEQRKRTDRDRETEDFEYGKFAWSRDPEGNRVEVYQPRLTDYQATSITEPLIAQDPLFETLSDRPGQ